MDTKEQVDEIGKPQFFYDEDIQGGNIIRAISGEMNSLDRQSLMQSQSAQSSATSISHNLSPKRLLGLKWTLFLTLVLSNAAMIDFVVFEGVIFCKYQYSFSIALALYGIIFFGLFFMLFNRRINPFRMQGHRLNIFKFKYSGLSGLFWATNYVFLLMANPYTPGFYQTIFNELNVVLVAIASIIFLRRKYYYIQKMSILLIFVGGLIPVGEGAAGGRVSDVIWYLLYMFGAVAIGAANVIAENVFQNAIDKKTGKYLASTLQFYFASNIWALLFVLAFWMVPAASYKENFFDYSMNGLVCILSFGSSKYCRSDYEFVAVCCSSLNHKGTCGTDIPWLGIVGIWLSSTFSFISVIAGAGLARIDGAMYMTMGYTAAPIVAGITFAIQPLMGVFYTSLTGLDIASFVITFVGIVLFKYTMVSERFPAKYEPKHRSRFDVRYKSYADEKLKLLQEKDVDNW